MARCDKRQQKSVKEVVTLGVKGEVVPIDFTDMGYEAQWLMEKLHDVVYRELVYRDIFPLHDWSVRVKHLFENNKLRTVGSIIHIELKAINKLPMCGFKVRKEVFDTFLNEFGIRVNQWSPEHYWNKYDFQEKS